MSGSPWDSRVYGAVAARERSKSQRQPPSGDGVEFDPSCDALLNHAPSFPHIPKVNIGTRAELAVGAARRTPEHPRPR